MPKLYIAEEAGESVYEIFDSEVTFGRGAANGVQISDSHASKVHAAIRRLQGHWKLIDLESRSGTRVNGSFHNQHWLSDGDVVTIGSAIVRYAAEGAPEGPPAVSEAEGAVTRAPTAPARPAARRPVRAVPAAPVAVPAAPVVPRVAQPAVAPAPAAPSPRAPAPARAGAPSRAAAPSRNRPSRREDQYDDEYDDEGGRPHRPRKNNNGLIIVLGILGAIAFFFVMSSMFGSSMSQNLAAFNKADAMAEKRNYEGALAYAERNADPGGDDYGRLLAGMRKWRKSIEAKKEQERNAEAREYYDHEIWRKQGIAEGIFRAKYALPDEEIVQRLREFLTKYKGTPTSQEILHAEVSGFPMLRDAMREHASAEIKASSVLGAAQTEIDVKRSSGAYGPAAQDLEYLRDMNRLCMTSENWKELQAAVDLRIEDIISQARVAFEKDSQQFIKFLRDGRRRRAREQLEEMKDNYSGIPELERKVRELNSRL